MYGDDVRSLVHPSRALPRPRARPRQPAFRLIQRFIPSDATRSPTFPTPPPHHSLAGRGRRRHGHATALSPGRGVALRHHRSPRHLHRPPPPAHVVFVGGEDRRSGTFVAGTRRHRGAPVPKARHVVQRDRERTQPRLASDVGVQGAAHGAVLIPREARHGDAPSSARGQGEPTGRSPGIREKATDDASGPVRLQRPPDRSQRARGGGDDDDARGVHAEVESTGTRRRRLPREGRGARHRTNATEHGGERAPAPVHRARRIRQAGIRRRRPEDHSRRAAATRRRGAGGDERRRRDDDSQNSMGRIRGGTPREGGRPSAALDGDRGAREQERRVDVERAGPTRVRYRAGRARRRPQGPGEEKSNRKR